MTTVARVKWTLTHQTVNAGFCPQPAVGVLALNMNGGTLDARDFTLGDFHQLAFEAMRFDPAEVHAQHHIGPILRFGTARTRLNLDVTVVFVHFAGEHATELKHFQLSLQAIEFAFYFINGVFIVFFNCHIQQVFGIDKAVIKGINGFHNRFERGTLATQFLCTIWIIPDVTLSQFMFYFFETLNFVGVVKDTP